MGKELFQNGGRVRQILDAIPGAIYVLRRFLELLHGHLEGRGLPFRARLRIRHKHTKTETSLV